MLFRKKKDKKPSNIAMMDSKINEEYVEEKVTKIKDEDVELVMENEEAISKKLSNASPLRKYAELGKIMFAMLKDVKKGTYPNVPWFTIASIVVALLYVFNPFDLVLAKCVSSARPPSAPFDLCFCIVINCHA